MTLVTPRPIRVLLLKEDPEDLEELRGSLARARGGHVDLEWVGELTSGLERLSQGGIDAVLLDLMLPDSQGIATFERTYAFAPDVPSVAEHDRHHQAMLELLAHSGRHDVILRYLAGFSRQTFGAGW